MLGYIPLLNGYCQKPKNVCISIQYGGKDLLNIDIFTAVSAFEIDGLSRSILIRTLSRKRAKYENKKVLNIHLQNSSINNTSISPRRFLTQLTGLQKDIYKETQVFTAVNETNPDNWIVTYPNNIKMRKGPDINISKVLAGNDWLDNAHFIYDDRYYRMNQHLISYIYNNTAIGAPEMGLDNIPRYNLRKFLEPFDIMYKAFVLFHNSLWGIGNLGDEEETFDNLLLLEAFYSKYVGKRFIPYLGRLYKVMFKCHRYINEVPNLSLERPYGIAMMAQEFLKGGWDKRELEDYVISFNDNFANNHYKWVTLEMISRYDDNMNELLRKVNYARPKLALISLIHLYDFCASNNVDSTYMLGTHVKNTQLISTYIPSHCESIPILRTAEFFPFKITNDNCFDIFYKWASGRNDEEMLKSLRFLSLFSRTIAEAVIMMAIYLSNTEFINPTAYEIRRFEELAKYYLVESWQELVHPSSFVYIVNYLTADDTLSNYVWLNPYCWAWGIYNHLLSNLDDYDEITSMITGYKWMDTGPLTFIRNETILIVGADSAKSHVEKEICKYIKYHKIPDPVSKFDNIMVQRFIPRLNPYVFKSVYMNQLKI
jgi:hypothetical protein